MSGHRMCDDGLIGADERPALVEVGVNQSGAIRKGDLNHWHFALLGCSSVPGHHARQTAARSHQAAVSLC
ncbi:hypothetical protein D3C78_1703510 [compost metagenome]